MLDGSTLAGIRTNLGWYRHGGGDPTTKLRATSMLRAMLTPDGPATVLLDWSLGRLDVETWGPGGEWAAASAISMTAAGKELDHPPGDHPLVRDAARRHATLAAGASGDLYHALLPTIIEQRITAGEAVRQWQRLVYRLGEAAPGPFDALLLPPRPERLAGLPWWWFHPLGIEGKRATDAHRGRQGRGQLTAALGLGGAAASRGRTEARADQRRRSVDDRHRDGPGLR